MPIGTYTPGLVESLGGLVDRLFGGMIPSAGLPSQASSPSDSRTNWPEHRRLLSAAGFGQVR